MSKFILPRHIWLKERVNECIKALQICNHLERWDDFKKELSDISYELHYCSTEWEKYYQQSENGEVK